MGDHWCFNTECEYWGESHMRQEPYGYTLAWRKFWPRPNCAGCGQKMVWHDNWIEDNRTHDDGTKVIV